MMKTSRRRSREFAMQGLYQWQLARHEPSTIVRQISEAKGFDKCDAPYFADLVEGTVRDAATLETDITPCLDRAFTRLTPVERGILLVAGYELRHHPEVPYRVVINEAVELAKSYGGADGHKYVNGVLDKLAAAPRPAEARPARSDLPELPEGGKHG